MKPPTALRYGRKALRNQQSMHSTYSIFDYTTPIAFSQARSVDVCRSGSPKSAYRICVTAGRLYCADKPRRFPKANSVERLKSFSQVNARSVCQDQTRLPHPTRARRFSDSCAGSRRSPSGSRIAHFRSALRTALNQPGTLKATGRLSAAFKESESIRPLTRRTIVIGLDISYHGCQVLN